MALVTRQPTSNETPDTGQGGTAVTGNTNTGHGSTTASDVSGGPPNETKTCRWSGFAASPGGQIASVKLKFDWSENGSLVSDGSNSFQIQYSTNGGGAWTTVFSHVDVTSSTSSSSEVTLSNSQDLTQVQVRDRLQASGNAGSASVTASVSNIQIEVTTVDAQAIVMM